MLLKDFTFCNSNSRVRKCFLFKKISALTLSTSYSSYLLSEFLVLLCFRGSWEEDRERWDAGKAQLTNEGGERLCLATLHREEMDKSYFILLL